MRVEGAVWPHRTIRNKRQNDEGRTSEDQNVLEFIFCKHRKKSHAMAALIGTAATGYMMTTDAYWGAKWVEKVHEALAYGTLALAGLHVFGVVASSLLHRENLVKAMWTGRKRPL